MKPKKRNPQDATMRNVKAAKKRTDTLEHRLDTLEKVVSILCDSFIELTAKKKREVK